MRKGFVFITLMAVLALAAASIFTLRSATPVSAQQVLQRSSAAQLEAEGSTGILHTRVETYKNADVSLKGEPASKAASKVIHDSFGDLQSGKYRRVVFDAETGRVVDAAAFDGTYVYSSQGSTRGGTDSELTVYRHAQPNAKIDPPTLESAEDLTQTFEAARNDPNVTLVGQEAWEDGRPVYVLRSDLPNARAVEGASQVDGYTTLYFDAETYKLLETRMTIRHDGKETLASYHRTLVEEILPDTAPVAWDLSDVQGVAVVEDPEGKHTDVFVEPISPQELAAQVSAAYRLRTVPDGLEMQIVAPPQQQEEQPIYIVRYDDPNGGYIAIQGGVELPRDAAMGWKTYSTANGLKLYFEPRLQDLPQSERPESLKHFQSAIVEAPDGASFSLATNLPLDLKDLAEDLVPIQ